MVGKRLNANKKWFLGDVLIDEVNEYKYFGVYFSRTLTFNHYIEKYLKENFEKKLNYIIRVLGEHGDFNRFNFGCALWISVIRPSIAHACGLWYPRQNPNVRQLAVQSRKSYNKL